jgi:hypothetical protein
MSAPAAIRCRSICSRLAPVMLAGGMLAGCSTGSVQMVDPSPLTVAPAGKAAAASAPNTGLVRSDLLPQIGPKVKARAPDAAYQLTADELKLDCKRLTGRMQVRILQVRDQRERTLTSKTAQAIQSTVVPVFGGSPHGANPADDFRRDRAWLEAYNGQLAAKKCPVFDLENELQSRSIRDTPQPLPIAAPGSRSSQTGKTRN